VTVVTVRAAGTVVGDFVAGKNMLGLALSTLVTGALFVALLVLWREWPLVSSFRNRRNVAAPYDANSAL
jgi:uncharacterized membrane-anchored protein